MRRLGSSVGVALILVATIPAHGSHCAETRGDAIEVYGRITDWDSCPLTGVRVTATDNDKEEAAAISDRNGNYRLQGVVGAKVVVAASLTGFSTIQHPGPLFAGSNLWDAGLPVGIELGPIRLSGVVRSADQRPIEDATVTAHSASYDNPLKQVRTNAVGEFTITVYQPGQYVVYATRRGWIGAATIRDTSELRERGPIALVLSPSRSCP